MRDEMIAATDSSYRTGKPAYHLWLRIVSGLTLALMTLALLYAGPKSFAVLVLIVVLIMCWEWGRVVRGRKLDISFLVHATTACASVVLSAVGQPGLALALVLIGTITVFMLNLGTSARASATGVVYVALPAVSLLWLRADEPHGFSAVLLVFAIVWASDTAAFVAGKAVGGIKLWPSVSPNKTWAGLIFAIPASAVIGLVAAILLDHGAQAYVIVASIILGVVAQAGDLAESALKRGFGVKDSSDLIPGHGGFMDRMDGVVAVAAAAGVIALATNPMAPAHGLLFGA